MSTNCALAIAIQAGVPILTWGPPGVGKTATITMLADVLALPLEVVLASIREPSDFSGLPVIGKEGVRMEPPAWAHRLALAGKGLLFLDEISTAPPAVQSALLRVVLERAVGDLALPASVSVVAPANPPEQAVCGWDLSAPLANRFCHLFWSLDTQGWIDGMIGGWSIPELPHLPSAWENSISEKEVLVAAFIRHRPHLLLQMPKDEGQAGKAWPSPRSWSMTARYIGSCGNCAGRRGCGCFSHSWMHWRRSLFGIFSLAQGVGSARSGRRPGQSDLPPVAGSRRSGLCYTDGCDYCRCWQANRGTLVCCLVRTCPGIRTRNERYRSGCRQKISRSQETGITYTPQRIKGLCAAVAKRGADVNPPYEYRNIPWKEYTFSGRCGGHQWKYF